MRRQAPGGTSNSINLLTGTTGETKYDENKRGSWAKLIGRDPFTGWPAILISSPEKQIGTSKLLLKNSFSTQLLLLSQSLPGVRGWKIPGWCWQWRHYYDKHLHFIYWSVGGRLVSSSTALEGLHCSEGRLVEISILLWGKKNKSYFPLPA